MPKKLSTSTKASSRYNNDCSVRGITSNFIKIRKDASIPKSISTKSALGDYKITKIPVIGKGIKYLNMGALGGSHIAHGINAYNESCRTHKKK